MKTSKERDPRFVVCVKDNWKCIETGRGPGIGDPKKGDIDEIVNAYEENGILWYDLKGRPDDYYAAFFRPVEPIGEVIAEWIESVGFKQLELEEAEREMV